MATYPRNFTLTRESPRARFLARSYSMFIFQNAAPPFWADAAWFNLLTTLLSSPALRTSRLFFHRLNDLAAFLYETGLEVSPHKSALMVFTKRRIVPANYSISLNETTIRPVSSCKFLGVLLEPGLTGHLYAKHLICKCGKLTNILKFLRGTWWGSNPKTLLCIFKALIRGSTDYASFLFPFHNAGLKESLERVLRRALRYCVGLRRSTPCNISR